MESLQCGIPEIYHKNGFKSTQIFPQTSGFTKNFTFLRTQIPPNFKVNHPEHILAVLVNKAGAGARYTLDKISEILNCY